MNLKNLFCPNFNVSDKQWLEILIKSIDGSSPAFLNLPSFPDEKIQVMFVGSSWKKALKEGATFYGYCKRLATSYNYPILPNSRVLDFGCGWGRYARFFMKDVRRSHIFGVDIDPDILDICRQTEVPGNFHLIDHYGKLPFEDSYFDFVTAYSVFTHLPENLADHWIKEISRVMKPNGLFVLTLEPRRFLAFIFKLPASGDNLWHKSLRKVADDSNLQELQQRFDCGEYVYLPTGGGEYRSADVYGEAVVSPACFQEKFGSYFNDMNYLDDETRFWQAVMSVRKKSEPFISLHQDV